MTPKSTKNRCQNPLRFRQCFSNDFWSMSIRKAKARPPKINGIRWFSLFRMQTGLFELLHCFVTVLVPTGLHFSTKNGPKSIKKSIKNDLRIWLIFWSMFYQFGHHFGTIVAPFWTILQQFWDNFDIIPSESSEKTNQAIKASKQAKKTSNQS